MAEAGAETLRRLGAGSYRTADGRFTVEHASGRWIVLDAQQVDDLGLPLARGPFGTLDEAKAAIIQARSAPAPASGLSERLTRIRRSAAARPATGTIRAADGAPAAGRRAAPDRAAVRPKPARPRVRRYEAGEGKRLRAFWETIGFRSLGDDDASLDRLAERNPGLVLVAESGDRIVGTALGAWDGRRGWIYHVAVAPDLRRTGLGRRMIQEVERKLRLLGCLKVNVIVRDDNPEARRFWESLGYASPPARQFGREL